MSDWEMHVQQGWRQIVRAVVSAIERDGGEIAQVKEKFGGLRIYHHGGTERLCRLVDAAELLSLTICENCGRPGRPRNKSWTKTYCDACAGEDKQPSSLTSVQGT